MLATDNAQVATLFCTGAVAVWLPPIFTKFDKGPKPLVTILTFIRHSKVCILKHVHIYTVDKNGSLYDPAGTESWNMQISDAAELIVNDQNWFHFFSVRRLLGSRQVVTQCLCQLNELCSILHSLLFGSLKREHGPLQSPNCPYAMATTRREKHKTNKSQTKNTSPTKAKQAKNTEPKPGKTTSSQRTDQLYANCSNLCAKDWALQISKQHQNKKKHTSKAPGKGAKKTSTRCGNPGSTQPGSWRSQRDAHRAQQAPQSQDSYHALHERGIGPAAGTLPWLQCKGSCKKKMTKIDSRLRQQCSNRTACSTVQTKFCRYTELIRLCFQHKWIASLDAVSTVLCTPLH